MFRLDDIHPQMKWETFDRVRMLFERYGVCPVIAVIPDNRDPLLVHDSARATFWEEMRLLKEKGWTIAMHGLHHEFVTKESGILGIQPRSEFAGLPYDVQKEKLSRGKVILEEKGIKTDVFIAPAHSFDRTTCRALREVGFTTLSDGIALSPFSRYGLRFIPQILWRPRRIPWGTATICYHTDHLSEQDIQVLEMFIKENRERIVRFSDVSASPYQALSVRERCTTFFLRILFYSRLFFRRLWSHQ